MNEKKVILKTETETIFIRLAAQCSNTTDVPTVVPTDVPTGNEPSLVSITNTSTFYDMNISSA